ncbi:MAG: sulfatase-like hydrolase/transferase [bacterium]|nr:sulfatase-like hydrolase/transferase [bacterium]
MNTPNILLIISDQHRTDTMGFIGKTPCKTPNMDRLMIEGISFDRALSPCPLCGPARASMFAGKFPHQTKGTLLPDRLGVRSNDNLNLDEITDMMINDSSLREPPVLTDLLKAEGYHTAYAGKWHLGNEIIGNWFDKTVGQAHQEYIDWADAHGMPEAWPLKDFDVRTKREPHMSIPVTKVNLIPPEKTNDAWITDHAIRYITERPADKPFFITCGLNGPHPPFKIPEPYYSMYDPESVPEPPNFRPGEDEPISKKNSFYRTLWKDHGENWESWKKSVAVYWGFVTHIDDQIGRLIQCLESEGIKEDTLIIYCSDHGEMLGQHGLWHKMQAYEEALRVPLIMSAPWMQGGIRSNALTSLIDIPSTILGAAGIEPPDDYEGLDLTHVFEDGPTSGRKYLFSEQKPLGEFHGEVDWRMVTDNRYKYIWNNGDRAEFYDLEIDPFECVNLIEHPQMQANVQTYRQELLDWMEQTTDPLYSRIVSEN